MTRLVCINGSPCVVSRTAVLINAVAKAIAARLPVVRHDICLAIEGAGIFSGLTRETLSPAGERVCRTIEGADVLVIGSPVYRASYTGLLKHLFDLIDRKALRGCKAVLVASGGSLRHGLVIEHQMRPLMGFFDVSCVATGLYALEGQIDGGEITDADLSWRAVRAADEIANLCFERAPSASSLQRSFA